MSNWNFDGNNFSNDSQSHKAISGMFNGAFSDNVKNLGSIPNGKWEASNCGVRTGGIYRCDLNPIGNTDSKGRTNLQVHERSNNPVKALTNTDSKGCIATDGARNVKNGDIINVNKKK